MADKSGTSESRKSFRGARQKLPTSYPEVGSFPDRIREVIGEESVRAFASRCGVSNTAVRQYLSGKSEPTRGSLLAIAQTTGVSVLWLTTGEGPIRPEGGVRDVEETPEGEATARPPQAVAEEYVLVPRYNVAASAGPGMYIQSEQIVDHLAFKRDWIRQLFGGQLRQLALISARGDSMEPTIKDGDLLLLDMNQYHVVDAIYVLRLDDFLIAKRLQRMYDGTIHIRSDNPAYTTQIMAVSDATVAVVGRVIWFGRRL